LLTEHPLIRLVGLGDGAYLVPDTLEGIAWLPRDKTWRSRIPPLSDAAQLAVPIKTVT
jgi:hypothetical protein